MPREPVTAYIGIGANLGDALQTVRHAIGDLDYVPGVQLITASALYRTAPIDSSGPDYINAVAALQTTLCAPDLLMHLQALESCAGRERPYRNAPRTLDLDLLMYGDARITSASLEVPHPRMWDRAFVVMPLAEIAPWIVGPHALVRVGDQRIAKLNPCRIVNQR